MIFVSSGHNDLCRHSCNRTTSPVSADDFSAHLSDALDLLSRDSPNSLVVVLPPADPAFVMDAFHRPLACRMATGVFCPCARQRETMAEAAQAYREEIDKLASAEVRLEHTEYLD